MQLLFLAVAFILELIAFAAFAAVGYLLPIHATLQLLVATILLILVVAFWGLYMAPKAPRKLEKRAYYLAKFSVYGISAIALLNLMSPEAAVGFTVAVAIDEAYLIKR